MADNESRPRELISSSSSQTRRSPKLEFTIVNDFQENDDRHRQQNQPTGGASVDNFSPMMVPIDPMLATPELSYHMMGYQGMPPGYPQSRRFPAPIDYAAPGYNPYLGLALEEQHRMAGLGAAPFPGNPLMYMSGTYHPLAAQQYSMYSGHPTQSKPAPPPPPSSHIPVRRPQNPPESVNEQPRVYDRSVHRDINPGLRDINRPDPRYINRAEARDITRTDPMYRSELRGPDPHLNRPDSREISRTDLRDIRQSDSYLDRRIAVPDRTANSYLDLRIDVPDRTIIRHGQRRQESSEFRYHPHEAAQPYHERDTCDRYAAHDYRYPGPQNETRYRQDRVEVSRERPRHVNDAREPNRSDYDRTMNRRDPRHRSLSPAASRFDHQRSYEPPRRPDEHRYEPRFDRRSRDKSAEVYQSRQDYGSHNERQNRDLRNERTALTGRALSREPVGNNRDAASLAGHPTDPARSRVPEAPIPVNTSRRDPIAFSNRPLEISNKPLESSNKPLTTFIASHKDGVKLSSPEEGEISLKIQLAQKQAAELPKPADPRRPSVESRPEAESKSHSKDSMTSKTESGPTRMLFCRNIPKSWTETKLQELFGRFGEIVEMNLTHLQSRGIAFIRFYDIRSAIAANTRLDSKFLEEYGSDATLSVHFSKSEEEKSSDTDCTLDHHQVNRPLYIPTLLTMHQGTLLVQLTRKEFTHSMKRKLVTMFSNYGPIKATHDASVIGKPGLLIEYYDARHCAAAFYALNRTKLGSLVIRLSLEWDIQDPDEPLQEVNPVAPTTSAQSSGFFIDVHGDDRKRRLSSSSVDVQDIIGKDITHDAVVMERVEKFPPDQPSAQSSAHAHPSAYGQIAETSTPILLQQMSSLLSSLQKKEPPRKKAATKPSKSPQRRKEAPKPVEVPVKADETAVVSSGGVVSADRMKKAPTLESVQQLAKLLLQQTRDTS